MKNIICSIYDKATEAYMRPFVAQSIGQATRMFLDEVNNRETPLNAHPEDYTLFHVGNWYDQNALLEPIEPKCLARAHEIITKTEEIQLGLVKEN